MSSISKLVPSFLIFIDLFSITDEVERIYQDNLASKSGDFSVKKTKVEYPTSFGNQVGLTL